MEEKHKTSKIPSAMKLTVLSLAFSLSGFSANIDAQQVSVSVTDANVKTVLTAISHQTGLDLAYSEQIVDMNRKVTLTLENTEVDAALKALFKDTSVGYEINNGKIYLFNEGIEEEKTAQDRIVVKGTVVDGNGEAIIGANVFVRGDTTGTITDFNGHFTLEVAKGQVLVISYIGFNNYSVKIENQKSLSIILKESSKALEEVVVVGFGTQKKVNLTGSVANVDNKLIQDRPITSVSAGLQGLLPGVTITQRSGQPGMDNGTIRIRGVGTFNNADPMVIVDGVESSMNNIDPNDIENISVLKDAASSAIYGSKAANGVILITTKRGKEGKAQISYAANFGWQSPTELPEYCSSAEYAMLTNEARAYVNKEPMYTQEEIQKFRDGSDPYNYPNTNWQDLLYVGSGFQQSHNIRVTGGDKRVRYMTSIGYQGQDGIIENANKRQYNVRINVDANPVKNVETSVSFSYNNTKIKEPTNPYVGGMAQVFRQVNMISPMVPYKNEDGSYGTIGDGNPIAWQDLKATTDKSRNNMLVIGSVKYTILKGLALKAQASHSMYTEDSNEFIKDIQYNSHKYHGPNKMYQDDTFENTTMGDIIATYDGSFNQHNLSILAGFHSELYKYKLTTAYRQDFPSNELGDINAGSEAGSKANGYSRELAMISWLGRVNYDYKGKYLFEANIRYDGSSRFTSKNRWGLFPSFSAGWRISEENFFKNRFSNINNLKIRASWGKLGNQTTSVGTRITDIDYYPTIPTINLGAGYPMNGTIATGAYTRFAKNQDLKWEETTTWGVGLDMTLINKINLTLDYYQKRTSGILMEIPTASTFALERYIDNAGKIKNQGVELSVNYDDQFGKVGFSFGGNVAYNKNKIVDLGGIEQIISGKTIKEEGIALNSFYGYKTAGFYQSEADISNWPEYRITGKKVMPGDLKYVDVNNDNVIDSRDRVVLDSSDPQITFGFNLGVQYAGFDVLAFFQGAAKVKGYMDIEAIGSINGDDGKPASLWMDRWTPENPNAKYPRVCETLSGPSMPSTVSSFWLQNANYLRLKNLQIGYTFPKKWLHSLSISNLRIYYSAQNILTFTKFLKGWDPEAPAGRGNYYPQTQVNAFGLNLTF